MLMSQTEGKTPQRTLAGYKWTAPTGARGLGSTLAGVCVDQRREPHDGGEITTPLLHLDGILLKQVD